MAMMGRYELVRALKGGGMAEVFVGRRRGPGGVEKKLVVKRIRREYARDPRFIRLFLSEARLSMTLAHKNIVPVFDFGRAGDELFFVMEYIDGVDLARALRTDDKPLDPMLAAFVGMEVCQALDYAHHVREERGPSGVIHRDVTPRNVLLSFAGEVKLADFGVATLSDGEAARGRVRGTPAYMSPEQARGDDLDGRADLFSLGLVLFEMLAGTRAYPGSDRHQLLDAAKRADVPALPEDVPVELREIVERATRADRADRFGDAKEMQRALDRFAVSRRARDEHMTPPNQLMAAWLSGLFPSPIVAGHVVEVETPVGSVVTFLDDGEQGIAQIAEPDEDGTMRSMAETAVETEATRPSIHKVVQQPKPSRLPLILGALVVVVVAMGVGWSVLSERDELQPTQMAALPTPEPERAEPKSVVTPPVPLPRPTPPEPKPTPKSKPVVKKPAKRVVKKVAPIHVKGPPGTLIVSTSPWARVQVLGTRHQCAETPCTLALPPGTYRITLTNPAAQLSKTLRVVIKSKQLTRVRETLTR